MQRSIDKTSILNYPLIIAAQNGNFKEVKNLIPEATPSILLTASHYALRHQHEFIAKYLLGIYKKYPSKININSWDAEGFTLLSRRLKEIYSLHYQFEKNEDYKITKYDRQTYNLIMQEIRKLLAWGADINAANALYHGFTPLVNALIYASGNKPERLDNCATDATRAFCNFIYLDVIQLLLNSGAIIDQHNSAEILAYAVSTYSAKIVGIVLSRISKQLSDSQSPWYQRALFALVDSFEMPPDVPAIASLLKNAGADFNQQSSSGKFLLEEVLKWIYCKDYSETSHVSYARDFNICINFLRVLLDNGADPNRLKSKGQSPLDYYHPHQKFSEDEKNLVLGLFVSHGYEYQPTLYNNNLVRKSHSLFSNKTSDLHLHLNGSFSMAFLKETAEINNAQSEFSQLLDVREKYKKLLTQEANIGSDQSIALVWKQFSLIHKIIKTLEDIKKGTIDVIATSKARYIEIRTTPKDMAGESWSKYVDMFISGLQEGNERFKAKKAARGLLSLDRTIHTETSSDAIVKRVVAEKKKSGLLVGIDISGNPLANRTLTGDGLITVLKFALSNDIGIAIHVGEVDNEIERKEVDGILQFLKNWHEQDTQKNIFAGKVRLGHGIFLNHDQRELIKTLKIPMEICPECHHQMNWWNKNKPHPVTGIYQFWKDPVVIGTDDEMIFGNNAKKESKQLLKMLSYPENKKLTEANEHHATFRFS